MTPFERAMKIHEDRYGVMAADGRHWRRTAFGLFCLLALSVVCMVTMALRSRVTPYVVQVDEHDARPFDHDRTRDDGVGIVPSVKSGSVSVSASAAMDACSTSAMRLAVSPRP